MKSVYRFLPSFFGDLDSSGYRVVVLCGLPGGGKSSLGRKIAKKMGFTHLSSDQVRMKIIKKVKNKFFTSEDYEKDRSLHYTYMREKGVDLLNSGQKVLFDATHLNEQRKLLLHSLSDNHYGVGDVVVVLVDGGSKENIKKRIEKKQGTNGDGRSWVEAWDNAYSWFEESLENGSITWPRSGELGYSLVTVRNI